MVYCSSLFQSGLIVHLSLYLKNASWRVKNFADAFVYCAIRISFPATLWLNIFYCLQIVPVGNIFLLRLLKNNLKFVIYSSIVITMLFYLLYGAIEIVYLVFVQDNAAGVNITIGNILNNNITGSMSMDEIIMASLGIMDQLSMAVNFLGLIMMLSSTGATVCYLYQHIKKMASNGTNIQSQPLQNQIRVTITGILQGCLYLICSTAIFLDLYCTYERLQCDRNNLWLIFSFYSVSTTINFGVGQSLFRTQVARLLEKAGLCLPKD